MLYEGGAKEVHLKMASPGIRQAGIYGVDAPKKEEILGANKSDDDIWEYNAAKSVKV